MSCRRYADLENFRSAYCLICSVAFASESRLPLSTVFKGQDQFNRLVAKAKAENWKALPIGERTAAVGQALVGTRYKHFTLEIDNRIESPSVNFNGMDCWTFFEIALGFARMLNEPESNWTPERMLYYIEQDRYRGGQCTGEYLSRLHYLEDWLYDNDRRGLVEDLTRDLGGRSVLAFRAGDEHWLATLPLSRREPFIAGATRTHGSERLFATALPDSEKSGRKRLNRNCAAATSSESFHATEADFIRPRMSAWRCAQAMASCISCTHPLRAITDGWSSTTSSRNICIATIRTAGSWSPGRCDKFNSCVFRRLIVAPIHRQDQQITE